jgi:hypothetical protein
VVHRLDAVLVLVPLEKGEVRDPTEAEHLVVGEAEAVPEVEPEPPEALEDYRVFVGHEEQVVAHIGAERFAQRGELLV